MRNHPGRLATICGERRQTFSQYGERVARLAGALRSLGLARGDRVGILAQNSDRYLEAYYGTWWAGGAVNPVNFRWNATEIAYSLDDCGTQILLVDAPCQGLVPELRARSEALRTVIYLGDDAAPAASSSS
jgi:long-chain acyl-CoA synthetase